MPKERDVQTPGGVVFTASGVERAENAIIDEDTHEAKVARFARILDMGYINDRFYVDSVPSDLHYEWVANDFDEIRRLKALGFRDGSEYVRDRTMHHDGVRPANVDVVLMVQSKVDHELWVKMRKEKFESVNRRGKTKQVEEELYKSQLQTLGKDRSGGEAVPLIAESNSQLKTFER